MTPDVQAKIQEHLTKADLIVSKAEAAERGMSEEESAQVRGHLDAAAALRLGEGRRYEVPDIVRVNDGLPGDAHTRTRTTTAAAIDPACPVLGPQQRAVDYLASLPNRGAAYEPITDRFCVGELVLSSLTGNRDRLSQAEERALSAGTGVSGGFVIEGQAAGLVIDLLRPATRVLQAGASIVPMTESTVKLAKVTSAGQPTWHVEHADDISDSGLTFGAVVLTAKTLPVLATCSVELVEDLNSSMMAQAIERELIRSIAQELDRSCLRGSGFGTEHITGLRNLQQVTKTELGSGNGLETTDHDWIVDAIARIWAQNLEPTAWITSSQIAARIAKYKTSGAGADNQPLRAPQVVEQLPRFITNQVPNNLTVGSSTDCGEAYFGVWPSMLVGMRTNMRIEATRTAGDAFKRMQVLIRCYLRADMMIEHGTAFQVVTGLRD